MVEYLEDLACMLLVGDLTALYSTQLNDLFSCGHERFMWSSEDMLHLAYERCVFFLFLEDKSVDSLY